MSHGKGQLLFCLILKKIICLTLIFEKEKEPLYPMCAYVYSLFTVVSKKFSYEMHK